jgi:shikimate dehydrogenase
MLRGAVLGSPISHSLSPVLHQGAFTFLGVSGRYEAIDVASGTLVDFFSKNQENFDYFSLTMPLKEEAFSLGVIFDDLSLRIGSANTLYRKGDQWFGSSTDGSGFMSALKAQTWRSFSRAMILGAGGTARAIAGALDSYVPSISVLGRTSTRRDALSRCVLSSSFEYLQWSDSFDLSNFDLVVNTTPAGAADLLSENLPSEIDALLFDVIYKPWPTVLASRWSDRAGQVINGKELLLWQGIDQLELVMSHSLDRTLLAPHLRELLAHH